MPVGGGGAGERTVCCDHPASREGSSSKQGSVLTLALIVVVFINIFSKELKTLPTSNLTVAGEGSYSTD